MDYHRPETIEECLGILTEFEGDARIIAGGTDLTLDIESKRKTPNILVDVTTVRGAGDIDITGQTITINAGATHARVDSHPELNNLVPALCQACGSVGSPQIRNVATLSGNVVNAQPAADAAMALIALGGKAVVEKPGDKRIEPVENLFLGPGQSSVNSTSELLTSFILEAPGKGQASAYGRISPRNSLCLPVVNTAVNLTVNGQGVIVDAKIAIGPVAKIPFIAKAARDILIGGGIDDKDLFQKAAVAAGAEASPRNSCLRGCSDYRKQLVRVLTRRVIEQAAAKLSS